MAGTLTPGSRLKDLRKQNGMTLADLAKATNIVMQQLSYMERGQRPITMKYAMTLATFFGVSIDYLIATDGGLKKRFHIQLMNAEVNADNFAEFMKEVFHKLEAYSVFDQFIQAQKLGLIEDKDRLLYAVATKLFYGQFDAQKLRTIKDLLWLLDAEEVQVP